MWTRWHVFFSIFHIFLRFLASRRHFINTILFIRAIFSLYLNKNERNFFSLFFCFCSFMFSLFFKNFFSTLFVLWLGCSFSRKALFYHFHHAVMIISEQTEYNEWRRKTKIVKNGYNKSRNENEKPNCKLFGGGDVNGSLNARRAKSRDWSEQMWRIINESQRKEKKAKMIWSSFIKNRIYCTFRQRIIVFWARWNENKFSCNEFFIPGVEIVNIEINQWSAAVAFHSHFFLFVMDLV